MKPVRPKRGSLSPQSDSLPDFADLLQSLDGAAPRASCKPYHLRVRPSTEGLPRLYSPHDRLQIVALEGGGKSLRRATRRPRKARAHISAKLQKLFSAGRPPSICIDPGSDRILWTPNRVKQQRSGAEIQPSAKRTVVGTIWHKGTSVSSMRPMSAFAPTAVINRLLRQVSVVSFSDSCSAAKCPYSISSSMIVRNVRVSPATWLSLAVFRNFSQQHVANEGGGRDLRRHTWPVSVTPPRRRSTLRARSGDRPGLRAVAENLPAQRRVDGARAASSRGPKGYGWLARRRSN
jgi:hypothetical protein